MARDSFEVYYYQNGRWQLHASFESSERELAVEEARMVESKEGYATRVVRETFFPESNTSEEVVSWSSPKAKSMGDSDTMFAGPPKQKQQLKRPAPKPIQAAPRPTATAKPAASKPLPKLIKKAKKSKSRGVLKRAFMVTVMSVGIAALVAVIAGIVVLYLPGTIGSSLNIVPGTFVLVFFLSFLVNLQRQFQIFSMLRSERKAPQASTPMTMQVRPQAFVQDVEFDQVEIEDLRAKIAAEDAAEEREEETDDDALADLDADMETSVVSAEAATDPEPAAAAPLAAQPAQAAAPPPPVAEKPKPPPKAPEPDKPAPKSAAEIEARTGFSKFVAEVMVFVGNIQMNAFSRFGLNLYLAGAASVMGQAKRLARDIQLQVLKTGLEQAGNSSERAEAFCVELPTYGKNPKYAGMVQAGVKAMTERMGGSANAAAAITALLNDWNLPDKRPSVPSVTTFIFTDIVGSTEMTQRLGNAGAQKAVRAHNNAVRGAIQARSGREVKHTGDGIMATFPDPPSAVAGAIQMQREIAAHNSANPNLQVFVRIGVNVGEAVEEDNDFFGAAVQMTARICDKATKGNIWVSQAVVDACKGQRIGFIPRGRFDMKGIQGAKTLYEVGWTDAHKNELADL